MPRSLAAIMVPMPTPLTVLDEEERLFQSSVREFAKDRIAPYSSAMDEGATLRQGLLAEMFSFGLMGIEVKEEYSGQGGSLFQSVLAVEELAKVDPAVSVVVDVQNTLVTNALERWATPEQKRKYLPRLATESVGAYALSEAQSGSDAFALTTRAVRNGGEFRLTGRKLWITNAAEADIFLVFATVDPAAGYRAISCFLVERGMPGFAVGKKENKLGIRASSTCELLLDDVPVPQEGLLGEPGKGYKIAIETLNEGRIGIGAQMLGLAEGALDHALRYAGERRQFGKPIGEFQGVQFELAEMGTRVEAARLLVYNAARLRDAGLPFIREAAMAKYFASTIAEEVASKAIEIFGGVGFTKDYPVEKLFRDAKIGRIYEGTSNMQRVTIAKDLLARR
ncbi:MAG TPA: acyl-CoA dehydrogenase [Bryobacteraceae bacterium]|jgi:butyryl-CoA dehydrogenase/short/branched chain acyl-CoA dehydrogenase|nr:acyl-CoA dehydrogenase [Bryobacteraceae bacterium]